MNRFEFDCVDTEKANAMRRYRRRRNFLNVQRAVEAIAAVALLGYWWLPTATTSFEVSGDSFRRITGSVVDSSFVVLVIVNLLIIWIVALSSEKTETEPDLHDQYTSAATAFSRGGTGGGVEDQAPEKKEHFQHKQIVPAAQRIDIKERPRTAPERFEAEPNQAVHCEAIADAKEVKSCRRTSSEQPRQLEYRRSETATVNGERVTAWRSRAMEELSNEEFRMTIETFIMEKKRTLLQENDVVQRDEQGGRNGDQSNRAYLVRSGGA